MTLLMRGATLVRAAIATFLEANVPATIDLARAQWELDATTLPYPTKYDAYEPTSISSGSGPLVGINVQRATGFTRIDLLNGENEYRPNYTVRVFLWVYTPVDELGVPVQPGYDEAIRARDDLTACIRSTILDHPSLGLPDAALVDESSLSEEYSEAATVKGDRWVAGVAIAFGIQMDEQLVHAKVGDADSVIITGVALS